MVSEAVQQGGGHLGVAEDGRPFAESEIGGDEDRGSLVEPADEVEEQLPAGLSEREIPELVEDDEVHSGQMVGDAALTSGSSLGFETIDEIDGGEEAAAQFRSDAASSDGDRQMGLASSGSAYKDCVTLLADEAAAGERPNEPLVDGRPLEGEVVDVLGKRQLGDGELVLDRSGLLFRDLGAEQIADEALRLVAALERGRERLVVSGAHAEQSQLAHHVEDFGAFHGSGAPEAVVAGAVGDRLFPKRQRRRRGDRRRNRRLAATRQNVEVASAEWTPSASAWAQAASTSDRPSDSTAARILTIWRSPSSEPESLRRTRSSAAGNTQSLNGAPLRSAPGLRASTGT